MKEDEERYRDFFQIVNHNAASVLLD